MGKILKGQHKISEKKSIEGLYTLIIENQASLAKFIHAQALHLDALSRRKQLFSLSSKKKEKIHLYHEMQIFLEMIIKKEAIIFKKIQLYIGIIQNSEPFNEPVEGVKQDVFHSFLQVQLAKESLIKSITQIVDQYLPQKQEDKLDKLIHIEKEVVRTIDSLNELQLLFIKKVNFLRIHGFLCQGEGLIIDVNYRTIETIKKLIRKIMFFDDLKDNFIKKELHIQLSAMNRLKNNLLTFEKEEQINSRLGNKREVSFGTPWLNKTNKK